MNGSAANDYLSSLAIIAATFVGFSTIFVSMRQALGGQMSKYDMLLTRNILDLGLMVVMGALMPWLLEMLGVRAEPAARVAGVATAVPLLIFNVRYPSQRHEATGSPTPWKVKVDLAVVYVAIAVLLAGAASLIEAPRNSVHALGLTILLGAAFLAFLFGLALLPKEASRSLATPEDQNNKPGGKGSG
jgi:hypothetical protein